MPFAAPDHKARFSMLLNWIIPSFCLEDLEDRSVWDISHRGGDQLMYSAIKVAIYAGIVKLDYMKLDEIV